MAGTVSVAKSFRSTLKTSLFREPLFIPIGKSLLAMESVKRAIQAGEFSVNRATANR